MNEKIIENDKNLNITEINNNSEAMRYEISAISGFELVKDGETFKGCLIFPAKIGLDNILEQVSAKQVET